MGGGFAEGLLASRFPAAGRRDSRMRKRKG